MTCSMGQRRVIVASMIPCPLHSRDAQAIARLEARCHPQALLEGAGFFTRLLDSPGAVAHGLIHPHLAGELAAYCLGHPVAAGQEPALGDIAAVSGPADWFIHDLVLAPELRGSGKGRLVLEANLDHARTVGYQRVRIVAVNASWDWWTRAGFAAVDPQPAPVLNYGLAVRMERSLCA